ncbi:MAG TPA: LLM class flavin-dependent oxidoreductase [Acidimicrobiales bacterium]|nr:LLM class flavin-dependent oxidoreductase [Acidimicrobiales bacterium]
MPLDPRDDGAIEALAAICRDAEAAGAGGLWAIDHLFWPRALLECLTALTVAATATSTVPLGSCVLQLPLRQPAAVAKQTGTIQQLSGGRFILGVGVGSHRDEYEAAGVDFSRRGRSMDQGIDALRLAWASGDESDLAYRQSPASAPVPVWIGGSSTAARRRAARTGDGWVPLFLSPDQYAQDLARLRDETGAAGRDPGDVTAATVVFVHVGPEDSALRQGCEWLSSFYGIPPKAFARHLVAGSARSCAERLVGYADAGAEHVVTMIADDHAVDHFAELVDACALAPGPGRRPGVQRPEPEFEEVPA